MMGIRKSIVLHQHGLATLNELRQNSRFLPAHEKPSSQILVVVCSGLRWFVVVCLHRIWVSLPIVQILVVICGGLR